jgi:AraC-like DNA-binding protein
MHSSRLLLETSLPLEGVAEQSGFANASHLHRAFQRYYLCTPGEYRRQGRRGP